VLPNLRFSREFGLFFVEFPFFLKICGLLLFGLVLIEIYLHFVLVFLQISVLRVAFFKFYGTFAVSIYF